ncbi:MAG: hypothetical protein FJ044_04825 [Candidatus Cloacimonetes bacterium]|nr:hypothetical protein [Candidatus Cloacimonadota bacterium]
MAIIAFFFLFLLFFNLIFLIKIISDIQSARGGAPYVGIPIEVAQEALKLAGVNNNDTLYDLGCGDGRVLHLAIEDFNINHAVGYEIALWPYLKGKLKTQNSKLKTTTQNLKLKIYRKDLLKSNISEATIVFLYLYPKLLEKLVPKLKSELPAGARVISCRYPLPPVALAKGGSVPTRVGTPPNNVFKIVKTGEVKGIKIWVYTDVKTKCRILGLKSV